MSNDLTTAAAFRSDFPSFARTGFRTKSWSEGLPATPDELRPFHATLIDALVAAADLEETTGITLLPEREGGAEEHRSYRDLLLLARRAAGGLVAQGVKPGDRLLMVFPTSFEFVTTFFGAQLLGAIPVPAYPPEGMRLESGLDRLGQIAERADARFFVSPASLRGIGGAVALRARCIEGLITAEALADGPPVSVNPREDTYPAFLQFTSGSTGSPKGVQLSHGNLTANVHASGQAMRMVRSDRVVSWLPLYHDMGLIGCLLLAIYWRVPLVLLSPPTFLRRPSRWLWAIHQYRGTLSPAPNFAYALCVKRIKPEERVGLDLSSWRVAFNGAEPVSLQTLREFEGVYASHGFSSSAFLPVYGLAEASLATAFPVPGEPVRSECLDRQELGRGRAVPSTDATAVPVVSVGTAVPGHLIRIVDSTNRPLAEREVGHIVVAGKSVMEGYYRDPTASNAVLSDGWLWTGDLGYLADGQLYVTGRAKDMIIVRGRNFYAEDVERSAEGVSGVRTGGCVAFGVLDQATATESLVLVCETRTLDEGARDEMIEGVNAAVLERCEVPVGKVVLVRPGTVPKTPSGKRQRARCRELYLTSRLEAGRLGKVGMMLLAVHAVIGVALTRVRRLRRG